MPNFTITPFYNIIRILKGFGGSWSCLVLGIRSQQQGKLMPIFSIKSNKKAGLAYRGKRRTAKFGALVGSSPKNPINVLVANLTLPTSTYRTGLFDFAIQRFLVVNDAIDKELKCIAAFWTERINFLFLIFFCHIRLLPSLNRRPPL